MVRLSETVVCDTLAEFVSNFTSDVQLLLKKTQGLGVLAQCGVHLADIAIRSAFVPSVPVALGVPQIDLMAIQSFVELVRQGVYIAHDAD